MEELFSARILKKAKRAVPFSFVLDLLEKAAPYTKPMFGCLALYVEDKIMLILRDKEQHRSDNGIWVATTQDHHLSLRDEFPSIRSIEMFGGKTTGWQNLPADAQNFEESATHLCELILAQDPRIGKIPKSRSKTKKRITKRSRSKK